MRFHRRCGDRVTLLNDDYTAVRNFVEFNHGLVLSSEPLEDDVMFEVCIDRKVNVWNGSLEIGVTTLDPEYMELPATATKLRDQAWILSGSSVVMDGVTLINSYGPELDTLREGDCVGVMRSSKAELLFYINGRCLGIAATDMPANMFAVIDLYGQCVQVTKTRSTETCFMPIMEPSVDLVGEDPNNDDTLTVAEMEEAGLPPLPSQYRDPKDTLIPMTSEGACALVTQDRLRFHPRCGILVKLSSNNKTAERARPLDDYNNGVVMTHRPLYDNELFEIRIDRLVDKWSGSIEVGVTTHNPATIRFPSTMTNMETGTIMMSGCKVLLNGHGTCIEYGNFNLDELREGDTVGMMRKSNGKLHYYVNGVDQGVATDKVDPQVWGVIDLYGMTVKVTIIDPCEDLETSITNTSALEPVTPDMPAPSRLRRPRIDEDSLLFHTLRDSNVIIINDGKTAHRPNAFKYFNNGIVMTNRTLRTNELFQVRLDLVIPKWAGSIEIGVTQQSSNDIKFPFKMSNAKSGTWAVTGEDVIRDGVILIPQYVRNLNKLMEGDTVGVMRKELGILHFFVNGVDQGPAAFNVPDHVFGIIDLYGRAAQATIVETYTPPAIYSPESPLSTESNATIFPEMCFHRVHGRNARLSRNRLSAWRATVYSEFNDAVLFSSRPLRECDMFELRIDKMVDCWIGSLEIGVTAIRPEDLEASGGVGAVAGTATDLNWDTYILSGAAMMKDGECVRSGYPLDLDTLTVGSRVGMMWHADRSLHYYLDGMDMGKAWYVPHLNIYAVIDLYGQCTQVTILQNEERVFNYNTNSDNSMISNSRAIESPPPPYWSFSEYCGDNVCLLHDYSMARRLTADPMAALVFSSAHLVIGEIFEIKIVECRHGFAGSFKMGVTDINILNAHVNRSFPKSVSKLPHYTAYIDGKYMKYTQPGTTEQEVCSFVPSLEWLKPGDRLGLKKTNDARVLVYYNSELLDTAFERVPDKVYVVMEIYGPVSKIQAVIQGNMIPGINQLSNADLPTELPIQLPSSIPNEPPIEYTTPAEAPRLPRVLVPPTFLDLKTKISCEMNPVNEEMAPIAEQEVQPDSSIELNVDLQPDSSTELNVELPLEELPVASEDPVDETKEEQRSEDEISEVIPTSNDDDGEHTPQDEEQISDQSGSQPRRRHLPYTFYYVHGKNIKLCSSDTVAMRTSGYNDAIAIVSHPLRRGHNFRFRVDKMARQWWGTVAIGAIGSLPGDVELPSCAVHMMKSAWFLTNELIHDTGNSTISSLGTALDDLSEHSVLTIHFRFNSELVLEIDGKMIGVFATIARNHSHVFPTIDLYGKVTQVSVLLHPYLVVGCASFDLPVITENLREETLAEQELTEGESAPELNVEPSISLPEFRPKRKMKTFSQENLLDDEPQPVVPTESINVVTIEPVPSTSTCTDVEVNKEVVFIKTVSPCAPLHHSLILPEGTSLTDNNEIVNRGLQRSHSTYNLCQDLDNETTVLRHSLSAGDSHLEQEPDDVVVHEPFCDTNIRHNDRYPEAIDVDNLDSEIMEALTLETGNLPDLTEEQSSSIDESRMEDCCTLAESLYIENLRYLNRILLFNREGFEGQNLITEWQAMEGGCEHLHLVLKYWRYLVIPYPEIRQMVSWGQVRCYCPYCQPDAQPTLAGWVRIERIDYAAAANLGYWHVTRSTLGSAEVTRGDRGPMRRPRCLPPKPCSSPLRIDFWFDEEGKPHQSTVAIEIDLDRSGPENDRLLAFLIFLKPYVPSMEDSSPTLDEEYD